MLPGKSYLFKHTTQTTLGQIDSLKYRVDVNTLHRTPAPELALNEIGRCSISVNQPLFYDAYRRNRGTGSFIIIDRVSNITVGAGMISDRSTSSDRKLAAWETVESDTVASKAGEVKIVSTEERKARFGQNPATVLITGLTGTYKLKIAFALERRLFDAGRASIVIDGERMRQGMNSDLGYSVEDRSENLRRSAFTARLINDNGIFCIASFIAPSQTIRERVAETIGSSRMLTIYLNADEKIRRQRDTLGQYEAADAGKLINFPGVTAAYEVPENPDMALDTGKLTVEECVDKIYDELIARGFLK
jgi:bifunctional enzyme CysN/CysC